METLIKLDLSDTEKSLKDLETMISYVKKLREDSLPKNPLAGYEDYLGERALKLFQTILSYIEILGQATLEEIGEDMDWNCSAASLRGTMMNAGRTLKKIGKDFPFESVWEGDRMVYTAKK
jgi:hypothetical protein